MTTKAQEIFIKTAQEKFSFLLDKGFKGPFLVDNWPYNTAVLFVGTNVALECVLDEKDDFVGCYVLKVINGQPAQGALRTKQGEVVGFLLHAWVSTQTKIPEHFFTKVPRNASLENSISISLENDLRLLKEYGQKIIEDNPDIFPNM